MTNPTTAILHGLCMLVAGLGLLGAAIGFWAATSFEEYLEVALIAGVGIAAAIAARRLDPEAIDRAFARWKRGHDEPPNN